MTRDDIARLRTLYAVATPGPWHHEQSMPLDDPMRCGWVPDCVIGPAIDMRFEAAPSVKSGCDAIFIAAAHNAIPALLDAAEEAIALREAAKFHEKELLVAVRSISALRERVEALGRACERKDDDLRDLSHCVCSEAHKSRGLKAHDCNHNYAEEIGKR
jgi:hypothetical protein